MVVLTWSNPIGRIWLLLRVAFLEELKSNKQTIKSLFGGYKEKKV